MNRIFLIIIFTFVTAEITAQTKDHLQELNDRLNLIYSQVFENIDTANINIRESCYDLIKQHSSQIQSNGYRTLALLDMYGGKYTNSIIEFKKAITLDSTCFICYRKLHWIYWYQKNDYPSATLLWKTGGKIFETMVKDDTTSITNWQKLYVIYSLNEGTVSKEIRSRMNYIACKIVMLDSTKAYNWWQYSFHQGNNISGEEYSLTKAYNLEPGISIYWDALAGFYAEHKNIVKLKELLENVRPKTNEGLEYWYQQKAYYFYSVGLKKEASTVYNEAKGKGFKIVYK
jgi:hypothetical protein